MGSQASSVAALIAAQFIISPPVDPNFMFEELPVCPDGAATHHNSLCL